MPTRVERDWIFNPESAIVSGLRRSSGEIPCYASAILYEIHGKTVFDKNVWDAWWDKEGIAITYDEYIFGPNIQHPPRVIAKKIERAPEGVGVGQLATGATG